MLGTGTHLLALVLCLYSTSECVSLLFGYQRFSKYLLLCSSEEKVIQVLNDKRVLFVPRHWWHYVESLDPVTVSINSWIEMDIDDEARVQEALTKTIVCALKCAPSSDNDHWLNPTEERVSSHDENMQYLNLAVNACMDKTKDRTEDVNLLAGSGKRDYSGLLKTPASDLSFVIPYGPHLIPVNYEIHSAQKPKCTCTKDTSCSQVHKNPSLSQTIPAHLKCEHQEAGSSGTSDGPEAAVHICTNDMLECLVHPDVIALITKLLMHRQRELHH